MKGDVIVLEQHHVEAGERIAARVLADVDALARRYILTVSGESGSGKSEVAAAIRNALETQGIRAVVLGQDDYFNLPPKSNDAKRRADPSWLGPYAEVKMDLLNRTIIDALGNADSIVKPLVDYGLNTIIEDTVSLSGVGVLIIEGTYTALLRHVDLRVFIARSRVDTLEHRRKRNRGDEADDPFVETILATEHLIIAGFRYLADVLITNDYDVIFVE